MNKNLKARSRISIILALLVLSFAFIICGISSYSFNAKADTNSVTATLVSDGSIWGSTLQDSAPNDLTGQSYSPATANGFTMNFSESVDISSLDKSKLVIKIWVNRATAEQNLCQMNLNGNAYNLTASRACDSSSNPINEKMGSLTGWLQLQFPITNIQLDTLTSFWIFVGNNGNATATSDMLLYEKVEFAEVDNPTCAVLPIATSITLNTDAVTLTPDSPSAQLTVTKSPEGTHGTVAFESSDESVAKVDANGTITALKNGTCDVTASLKENPEVKATCSVTVSGFAPITEVSINGEKTRNVTEKGSIQLTYSLKNGDEDVSADSLVATWESDNKNVATVSADGKVEILHNGTATITLTVGGKQDSVTFNVSGLSNRVDLVTTGWFWELSESEDKPIGFNGTVYSLYGQPSGQGFTPDVQQESLSHLTSNKAAAFMWIYLPSADTITDSAKGIYVVSYHNGSVQTNLSADSMNALEFVTGWNLVRIPLGDTANKTINKFWILMNGNLGEIKMSMPWIDEVTDGDCTYAILETQTLYKSLQTKNTSITVTEEYTLQVTGTDGQFGTIAFESSDENIVSVDNNGKLTPRRNGETTVIAYLSEDNSVRLTINVIVSGMPEVTSITVTNGTNLTLKINDEHTIEVSVLEEGALYTLEYSSDNKDAVQVNSRGKIIAVGEGTATITVKVSGTDISATISVTSSNKDANSGKSGCGSSAIGGYSAIISALALTSVIVLIKKRRDERL